MTRRNPPAHFARRNAECLLGGCSLAWIEPDGDIHLIPSDETHWSWAQEREDRTPEDLLRLGWMQVANPAYVTVQSTRSTRREAWQSFCRLFLGCLGKPDFFADVAPLAYGTRTGRPMPPPGQHLSVAFLGTKTPVNIESLTEGRTTAPIEDLVKLYLGNRGLDRLYAPFIQAAKEKGQFSRPNSERSRNARTKRFDFTPSYPAGTEAEYRDQVNRGFKRDEHTVVGEGRRGVRYQEASEKQTAETTQVRKARWAYDPSAPQRLGPGAGPPWDARTQSEAVRRVAFMHPALRKPGRTGTVAAGPLVIVARAIDRMRATQPRGDTGLLVPDTIWPLVTAGMPQREAQILVSRASGAFFPEVSSAARVKLGSSLLHISVTRVLGGPFIVRANEIAGPATSRRGSERLTELSISDDKGNSAVLLTAADVTDELQRYKANISSLEGRWELNENDRRNFLLDLFGQLDVQVNELSSAWNAEKITIELWFGSNAKEPIEIPFSPVEHSKLGRGAGRVETRRLRNVELLELPSILVRLARRGRKRGRRLTLAKKNPNPNSSIRRPDMARKNSSSARSNMAGRPGKHGLPRGPQAARGMGGYSSAELKAMGTAKAKAELARRKGSRSLRADLPLLSRPPESYLDWEGKNARENPWYATGGSDQLWLPDTTETRSALVPGPYGRSNPGEVKFTKNGQPYVVEMVNGRRRARFIKKSEAARANDGGYWDMDRPDRDHPLLNYRRGQFATSVTGGWQPVNRRNPSALVRRNPGRNWQDFCTFALRNGATMKQAARAWNAKKNGR